MSKKPVKIVTIGGGSSYTPELMEGFIKRYEELPIKEIWLVDIEDGKEKVVYQIIVNKDSDALATTNKKDMIIYGGIVVGVILIFVIIIIIVKSKKKKKQQIDNDTVDDYSDLYGYSSKNATNIRNENQNNNLNDIQSNQYKQTDRPQENTNNESKINPYQSTDTTTQFNMDNEYKSTNEPENPYISKDMYADYNENSKPTYNNPNTYDGLYGSYIENNNQTPTNDIQEKSSQQDSYLDKPTQEDYMIDDNYKFKRSKGKHSK